ncbi:MAG: hypothetical protein HY308_15255 [Gammaproteobacteria bacterium]|nr:hypothetical protein [Gammaproteobacteria bacterium]
MMEGIRSEFLFSGQYVLGPKCLDSLPEWSRYHLTGGLWLMTHPTLPVAQVYEGTRSISLIGFIVDPAEPDADDVHILARLIRGCYSIRELTRRTAGLGGRWLLIAACDDGLFLFHDALGLRQAFYTESGSDVDGIWVVSQPGLAIDLLKLPLNESALHFLDSYEFRSHPEYRWPGASTPVKGLRHLLPNHYLNLHSGTVRRYWPEAELAEITADEAVERGSALLAGGMRAVAARFELVLSITAGGDSRLVLAAACAIKDRIRCATVRQARMADANADLVVPTRLLAKLGVRHDVVRANASMSPEFSWLFKRSNFLAHDIYGADAEAILAQFGREKVTVTGSGAEVGRCSFRSELPLLRASHIRAEYLAQCQRMGQHPYAVRCFEEWMEDARDRGNVPLLDLFEWEQGHGNWLAMTQLEFDIAWRDIYTPFNCRSLLALFLSVDERFRRRPDYALFKRMTKTLWPEVLSEPINPEGDRRKLRRWVGMLHGTWRLHGPTS